MNSRKKRANTVKRERERIRDERGRRGRKNWMGIKMKETGEKGP